jgi:hypothetical protein
MTKTLKKHKNTVVAGLVLVVFVLVYFYRDSLKSMFLKNSISTPNAATVSTPSVSSPSSNLSNDTILKKGSSGEQVKRLQELLNIKHGNNKPQIIPYLKEDGNFGTLTEKMLKKWTGKTSISINQLIKALK